MKCDCDDEMLGGKNNPCPDCGQEMGVLGVCYDCVTSDYVKGPKVYEEPKCPYDGHPCDPSFDPDEEGDPCYSCHDFI